MTEKIKLDASMNEVISWFQINYPDLVKTMKDAQHHYSDEKLNAYHLEGDVFTHTMMVCLQAVNYAPDNDYVRWSTLLHDIGKPDARFVNDEKQKTMFYGHEGLSAFMAIDILNATDISVEDKIMIFKIIALHGDLFRFMKPCGTVKDEILEIFAGEKDLLHNLVYQVRADSTGRFWDGGTVTDDVKYDLPKHFKPIIKRLKNGIKIKNDFEKPMLTVLVGPPASGKSTYLANMKDKATVISRDNLVMEMAENLGGNYNDAFKAINEDKELLKVVSDSFNEKVQTAKKEGGDLTIDMTSMSKKGRRKWVNEFSKYNKRAIVFLTGFEELKRRNTIRSQTGKHIPEHVLKDMCQRFSLPMYSEGFDDIMFEWTE